MHVCFKPPGNAQHGYKLAKAAGILQQTSFLLYFMHISEQIFIAATAPRTASLGGYFLALLHEKWIFPSLAVPHVLVLPVQSTTAAE